MGGRHVTDVPPERRLARFEPDSTPPHANGSRLRRRYRPLVGLTFGALLGGITAAALVSRVQWLNLDRAGGWGKLVLAATLAGALAGAMRSRSIGSAVVGALAGLVSLWGVYAMVRLSVRVLWVERSMVRVVTLDLARLALYGLPAGAIGAFLAGAARGGLTRRRGR